LPQWVSNHAGEPYTLYAGGTVLQKGLTDDTGAVIWDHVEGTSQYKVELATGQVFEIDVLKEFNSEGQQLANQGYRGFTHEASEKAPHGAEGDVFRKSASGGSNPV
jgi:type VI secretion system secreted protein VgrG